MRDEPQSPAASGRRRGLSRTVPGGAARHPLIAAPTMLACATATLVLAGCGGARGPIASPAATSTRNPNGAGDCPITAERLTTLFGVTMRSGDVDSCSFERADGQAFPNASYNKQYDEIFSDLPEEGYTETLDGVGDKAYIKAQADGVWVLAASGGHTFEVRVDSGTSDRQFAIKLAQLVIDVLNHG